MRLLRGVSSLILNPTDEDRLERRARLFRSRLHLTAGALMCVRLDDLLLGGDLWLRAHIHSKRHLAENFGVLEPWSHLHTALEPGVVLLVLGLL